MSAMPSTLGRNLDRVIDCFGFDLDRVIGSLYWMTNLEIDIGAWDQTSEVHFQRSEVY
jgi:hypothetical protein